MKNMLMTAALPAALAAAVPAHAQNDQQNAAAPRFTDIALPIVFDVSAAPAEPVGEAARSTTATPGDKQDEIIVQARRSIAAEPHVELSVTGACAYRPVMRFGDVTLSGFGCLGLAAAGGAALIYAPEGGVLGIKEIPSLRAEYMGVVPYTAVTGAPGPSFITAQTFQAELGTEFTLLKSRVHPTVGVGFSAITGPIPIAGFVASL